MVIKMAVMVKKEFNNEKQDEERIEKSDKTKMILCSKCNQNKGSIFFHPCYSKNNNTGYTYICKDCCETYGLDNGFFTKESAYRLCELIDKPYKEKFYAYTQNPKFKTEKAKLNAYIQYCNTNRGKNREEGFADSEEPNYLEDYVESAETIEDNEKEKLNLFGSGYNDEEYDWLIKKYYVLINNYPIRTEMHKEMLVKYCKYALREDQAIADNDMQSAKYWGDLASKTATSAKINPNQLSVSDLSDGMNCFSQIAQAVEREVDIIDHLPKYIKQPQDRVDYTIYMILDYLRDLEGKSHISYEDVWKFMYDKNKNNSKKFPKGVVPNDENEPDKNAILVYGEGKSLVED